MSLPIVTIYRAANGEASFRADEAREVVTFVQPEVRTPVPRSNDRRVGNAFAPARARPNEKLLNSDTGSVASPPGETPGNAAATMNVIPGGATGAPTAVGPVAKPVGVLRPPVIGAPPPPWRWLPPTQEELDSTAREQEQRMAEGRDQHRPAAIPLGGASIPVPFLSRGPTREQRARDSVIHADNLARLARLAERARAKRDSLSAVKALAGSVKLDSTPRLFQ